MSFCCVYVCEEFCVSCFFSISFSMLCSARVRSCVYTYTYILHMLKPGGQVDPLWLSTGRSRQVDWSHSSTPMAECTAGTEGRGGGSEGGRREVRNDGEGGRNEGGK